MCVSVFLISSYSAPLAQRASYLALHSSLFRPDGAVSYAQFSLWARWQMVQLVMHSSLFGPDGAVSYAQFSLWARWRS